MLYTLFKKDRDDYHKEDCLRLGFNNIYSDISMTIGRIWHIHYNTKWLYLCNVTVCCIFAVFLWRYPDDGHNSDRNMYKVTNNIGWTYFTGVHWLVYYIKPDIPLIQGYGMYYVHWHCKKCVSNWWGVINMWLGIDCDLCVFQVT